jgi:hypothetical protein
VIVVAVGLVVALAFGNLVKAFTGSIINPLIAAAQGNVKGPGLGWQLVNGRDFVKTGRVHWVRIGERIKALPEDEVQALVDELIAERERHWRKPIVRRTPPNQRRSASGNDQKQERPGAIRTSLPSMGPNC